MPLKITIAAGELETFLKVDNNDDAAAITMLKEAAINEAETFLNTDFSVTVENDDGTTTTTENEAPPPVKVWVFNRVAELYENRGFYGTNGVNYRLLHPFRVYPFKD